MQLGLYVWNKNWNELNEKIIWLVFGGMMIGHFWDLAWHACYFPTHQHKTHTKTTYACPLCPHASIPQSCLTKSIIFFKHLSNLYSLGSHYQCLGCTWLPLGKETCSMERIRKHNYLWLRLFLANPTIRYTSLITFSFLTIIN